MFLQEQYECMLSNIKSKISHRGGRRSCNWKLFRMPTFTRRQLAKIGHKSHVQKKRNFRPLRNDRADGDKKVFPYKICVLDMQKCGMNLSSVVSSDLILFFSTCTSHILTSRQYAYMSFFIQVIFDLSGCHFYLNSWLQVTSPGKEIQNESK